MNTLRQRFPFTDLSGDGLINPPRACVGGRMNGCCGIGRHRKSAANVDLNDAFGVQVEVMRWPEHEPATLATHTYIRHGTGDARGSTLRLWQD